MVLAVEWGAALLLLLVVALTLGRHVPGRRGLWPVLGFAAILLASNEAQGPQTVDVSDLVFVSALLLPPYGFGAVMRALADRNAQLHEQAELLARLQATVRRDATAAERARIARELHDVLAHSLSAMTVQASAAQDVLHHDPDRAARAIRDVSDTGRRALTDTGRLLHLLRDSHDELGLEPDLGLQRLEELVDQFRHAGLTVDLQVHGSLNTLPAGLSVSGYRIVQKGLTNALKYALDRTARLQVTVDQQALRVQADNRGRPGPRVGSGLGLVGMAERVQVFGGELTSGLDDDGRFTLTVRVPFAARRLLPPPRQLLPPHPGLSPGTQRLPGDQRRRRRRPEPGALGTTHGARGARAAGARGGSRRAGRGRDRHPHGA